MNKDLKRIFKMAEEQGFRIKHTATNHAQFFTAGGEFVTGSASTPSEYRGWHNMLSRLKRAGFKYAS